MTTFLRRFFPFALAALLRAVRDRRLRTGLILLAIGSTNIDASACAADGVYARFKLIRPTDVQWHLSLGGFIHRAPWRLPQQELPKSERNEERQQWTAGHWSEWIDLQQLWGEQLHEQLHRAGGVAELPNVTAQFVGVPADATCQAVIELAVAPEPQAVIKRWQETFQGNTINFLVSPHLKADVALLESDAEMTARRLQWARTATGGKTNTPQQLIVQTSFWAPQRKELNLQEAEVLRLLGFNVVGNQMPEVQDTFDFYVPGHTHDVLFGLAATKASIDILMEEHARRSSQTTAAGVPFGFTDEVISRPPIGDDPQALAHFHQWLAQQGVNPQDLGVEVLTDVQPIETPPVLAERLAASAPAARRAFYYTSRFRQQAATDRIRWHTESFHQNFKADTQQKPLGNATDPVTSTLLADHPYFFGSGLGMGMTPNPAWGGYPLACDWFEMARRQAVDLAGIEDWMGLQYMYGPFATFEGFQLMGFQAAIFRSGSGGRQATIAWITPSDETNLRLKSASALCQGAKHFFYWTYGPTATSTENYWSDLRGAYDGVAAMTRQLSSAEHIIAPGKPRSTRVALLYSISSDLWQPFGYTHMLERRGRYLALVHEQYLVDFLCEEDVEAGRLSEYDVLVTADPCLTRAAAEKIKLWVGDGGWLVGSIAAGSRDEFNEPSDILAPVYGIEAKVTTQLQTAQYHQRGALNDLPYSDTITPLKSTGPATPELGVLGVRVAFHPNSAATVRATFADGSPAYIEHAFGKGKASYLGACPGLAYIKEAAFVPDKLAETWPSELRTAWLTREVNARGVEKLASLSHPVVECGVYDSDKGTALILANFTYKPIDKLTITLPVPKIVTAIHSAEHGPLEFTLTTHTNGDYQYAVNFVLPLVLNDIVVLQ